MTQKRKDRMIKEKRHDVYKATGLPGEHLLCSRCGALFTKGRWTWNKPSEDVQNINETVCPACKRIMHKYPSGRIEMKGIFFNEHQDEIFNLVRNVEKLEKNERPLERIMNIEEKSGRATITTTGIHLARRIGESLSRSYQGNYSFQYATGDKIIRVYWER